MEDEKFIAVIYFGHTNITGVLAKKSGDNEISIITTQSEPSNGCIQNGVLKGYIDDITFKVKIVIDKLNNVLQNTEKKLEIKYAYVCINDYSISLVSFSNSQGIDNQKTYIKKENYEKIKNVFETIGITLKGIFSSPNALANCVPAEAQSKNCLIVDFGEDTTSMVLYIDKKIGELAIHPIGGNNITFDIQNIYSLKLEDAEMLKIEKATSNTDNISQLDDIYCQNKDGENIKISVKELADITEARVQEIWCNFIWDTIESFQNIVLNGGIFITGNGSKLNGLHRFIEKKTNIKPTNIGFEGFYNAAVKGILLLQNNENCVEEIKIIEQTSTPSKKKEKNIIENLIDIIFEQEKSKEKTKEN